MVRNTVNTKLRIQSLIEKYDTISKCKFCGSTDIYIDSVGLRQDYCKRCGRTDPI